jgi:hypothetical protein
MTEHKSFKRLVRARMAKTGESYTAARAMLLRAEEPTSRDAVRLATSDDRIRERTGRGWEEWFAILDEWGASERSHRETARWLAEQQGLHPLAWNVQAIASSYELARGLRVVGEKDDGFAITSSRTVGVDVARLYDAFVKESQRHQWLPDGELLKRTATRPKSALRLGQGRHPRERHVPRQGRGQEHGRARAPEAAGRRRGRAGEGLLAATAWRAQAGAGAMNCDESVSRTPGSDLRITTKENEMNHQTANPIGDVLTIGVPVTDQDQALEFYLVKLGFEKRRDVPVPQFGGRWIEVAPQDATVTIALVPTREGVPPGVQTGIRLKARDANAVHADLQARGVDVGELMRWPGVPPMFELHDQDGNGLEIVEAA